MKDLLVIDKFSEFCIVQDDLVLFGIPRKDLKDLVFRHVEIGEKIRVNVYPWLIVNQKFMDCKFLYTFESPP